MLMLEKWRWEPQWPTLVFVDMARMPIHLLSVQKDSVMMISAIYALKNDKGIQSQ
jgi:hypothetical protein